MQGGPSDKQRTSDYRHRAVAPDATEDFLFHLYRGSELLQDNRVHEAKEELEQALKLQPRDAKGQDLLAVVYFRLGLYPRAIEIYEELIGEFSDDAALAQNLSLCYLKTGQPDKARTILERLVMTQPDHLRAWSYLGLVFERLGDYEKARAAFERGQQPGMARRMEELIASAAPPRSLSIVPPGTVPPPSKGKQPPEAFVELEREITLVGIPSIPARSTTVPPPPAPAEAPSEAPASSPNGPVTQPRVETLGDQPPIAQPGYISVAPAPAPIHEPLPSLSKLAKSTLLPFLRGAGMTAHPLGLVLVSIETSFAGRPRNVHLLSADLQAMKTTPLLRRMRNRTLEEPLGGAEAPLVSFAGAGQIALGPADRDERLIAFRMDGDFLFLREAILVGFEETLAYENGRLAAFEGEAVALVQLRGRGGVVITAKGSLVTTDVKADHNAVVARDHVLGWAGRLLPRELSPEEAPGGARGLISFAGDGTVFAGAGLSRIES
jgi:Flp pilus assembly protein TadD